MQRKLLIKLQQHIAQKEFTILTGARQTGKSTLLKNLQAYCNKNNMPTIFLNLENKLLLDDLNQNPLNVLLLFSSW